MLWLEKNINSLRLTIVLLAITALIIGPWIFESLWVQGDFPCSPPAVRLNENFCGLPLQGFDYILWWGGGFIDATASMATGAMTIINWTREGFLPLVFLLPLLPLFSTLTLVFRRDQHRLPIINIISWGTALGICLWIGALNHPKFFFILWGLWAYIGLAVVALILEAMTMQSDRQLSQG